MKKRIGIISYVNSLPFLKDLDKHYDVVKDTPSNLADRFAEGELDAGFVPAVAYLKRFRKLPLVPGVSISSFGPVHSVFLKYSGELCKLSKVRLSDESVTSNFMIQAVLENRYSLNKLRYSHDCNNADAEVIIGDTALRLDLDENEKLLDIAGEWCDMTGLPALFAVCVASDERTAQELGRVLSLNVSANLADLDLILDSYGAGEYKEYIRNLDYSFSDVHSRSLSLLESMLNKGESSKKSLFANFAMRKAVCV